MLALSRKKGDSIMIGENVEVVVLSIQGEQVKIGIMAPREVSIHRKEIYEQIVTVNKEAAESQTQLSLSEISKLLGK